MVMAYAVVIDDHTLFEGADGRQRQRDERRLRRHGNGTSDLERRARAETGCTASGTRLHCAGGDTLILLFAFWVTSLIFRSRQWLRDGRRGPTILFVSIGFVYTVWSEWFNTRVTLSWQYAESMPRVFGIGLAPLAQWLAIPVLLALIFRKPRS